MLSVWLEPRYSRDLNPFVIRWVDTAPRPADETIRVTYDVNVPYQGQYGLSGQDHVAQRLNYCAIEESFAALGWGEAYDKMMGTDPMQLGASKLRIDLSEVRGVNRSHRCHERVPQGTGWTWQLVASNSARFAGSLWW